MKKTLTIVIPTFNMEKYLNRCLDSLIIEKEIMNFLEVLVINDGSTDSSSNIAHQYETQYPETFRVIDKTNGHYGSCVNRGIQEAKGKYFKVLDADDWFNTSELQKYLLQLNQLEDVDAVFTNWTLHNSINKTKKTSIKPQYQLNKRIDIQTLVLKFQPNYFYTLYGITYYTKLLRDINYHQTEGVCYTDTEYVYYPMMEAKTVAFIDVNLYQYFIGREGQSIDPQVIQKNISHYYKIVQRALSEYTSTTSNFQRTIQKHFFKTICSSFYFLCLSFNSSNNTKKYNLKQVDYQLKKVSIDIYKSLNKVKYSKIPYILIWRIFKLRFESFYNIRQKFKTT